MDGTALAPSKLSDLDAAPAGPDQLRLSRIAALLDCSVEAFSGNAPMADGIGEASELIGLWLAIPDPDARAKVLAFARALARTSLAKA